MIETKGSVENTERENRIDVVYAELGAKKLAPAAPILYENKNIVAPADVANKNNAAPADVTDAFGIVTPEGGAGQGGVFMEELKLDADNANAEPPNANILAKFSFVPKSLEGENTLYGIIRALLESPASPFQRLTEKGKHNAEYLCKLLDIEKNFAVDGDKFFKWHLSPADISKIERYANDNASELLENRTKQKYESVVEDELHRAELKRRVSTVISDATAIEFLNALVEKGDNVTFADLRTISAFFYKFKDIIALLEVKKQSALGTCLDIISAYDKDTDSLSGILDSIDSFKSVCNKVNISPTIEKDGGAFHWTISPRDYCRVVSTFLDTLKKDSKEYHLKDDSRESTTSATKQNSTLNYGANILTPSNDDIQDELHSVKEMSFSAQDALRLKINQLDLRKILPADRQGKGFICPFCGNGAGKKGDGIVPSLITDDKGKKILIHHCWRNDDFNGTLTKILACVNKLEWNAPRLLAIGLHLLNLAESSQYTPPPLAPADSGENEEEKALIRADITESQKHIDELPVEDRRGLSLETLKHFHCGYLSDWTHYKSQNTPPSRRLIIPSGNHYLASLINSDRTDANQKYWKQHAGAKEPFCDDITPDKTILIVEGEMDAMSLWQASQGIYHVVALGGLDAKKLLAKLAEKNLTDSERLQFQFLVMLDNDSAGRQKAPAIVTSLICAGYPAIEKYFTDEKVKFDANDILIREGDAGLAGRVDKIVAEVLSKREQLIDKVANVKPSLSADEKRVSTKEVFKNCPLDLLIPTGYRLYKHGLYFKNKRLSIIPLIVTRRFIENAITQTKTKDGILEGRKHFYQIAFYDIESDQWKNAALVSGGDIATTAGIAKLANFGLTIPPSTGKYVSEFLQNLACESVNKKRIPTTIIYDSPGWLDDSCTKFLYPAEDSAEIQIRNNQQNYKRQFYAAGDFAEWKSKIVQLYNQESPIFNVVFATVLAAPLIRLLKVRSQQLLIWCRSGRGKTAVCKAALSAFGAPSKLMHTFNGTLNSLDTLSLAFKDLPVWIDELQVSDKKLRESLDEFVYRYSVETGRRRCMSGGDLNAAKDFSGTRIMTAEMPLVREYSNAGVFNRILQLNAAEVFDSDISASSIHNFFGKHFGHFGKIWVDFISEHKAEIQAAYESNKNALKLKFREK